MLNEKVMNFKKDQLTLGKFYTHEICRMSLCKCRFSNFSDSASTNLRDVGIGIPQKNSSMNEEKKQQAPISNQQQQQNHQNQQPSNYDKLNSKEDLNSFNSSNESNNSNNNIMRTTKPPPYIPPPKVAAKSPDKPNIINPDDLLIKDLIQLIKLQREKIINQQNDLSKVSETFFY